MCIRRVHLGWLGLFWRLCFAITQRAGPSACFPLNRTPTVTLPFIRSIYFMLKLYAFSFIDRFRSRSPDKVSNRGNVYERLSAAGVEMERRKTLRDKMPPPGCTFRPNVRTSPATKDQPFVKDQSRCTNSCPSRQLDSEFDARTQLVRRVLIRPGGLEQNKCQKRRMLTFQRS